jgi:RNA polymerase sigma factor (sigma-70 family)
MYDVSDGELIYLYKLSSQTALDFLVERYKKRIYGLIEKTKRIYNVKYFSFDDIYHTCYISFLRCIENFNGESVFYSYVMSAMENVIYRVMEKEVKHTSILSLEEYVNVESYTLSESIHEARSLYEENSIKEIIYSECNDVDNIIVCCKYNGYSNKEIENITNLSPKQIYNRLSKIKKTLKNAGYH